VLVLVVVARVVARDERLLANGVEDAPVVGRRIEIDH